MVQVQCSINKAKALCDEGIRMAYGLESFFSLGFIVVTLAGLFWKYSALPEIDWKYIVAGAMFLFAGWATDIFGSALQTWNVATGWVSSLVAIAELIGAILIIVGALLNAFSHMSKK